MFKGIIISLLWVLFFVTANVHGQQIKPRGQFLEDSIKVGVPVGFTLAVRHPKNIDVVFPDSLYDFSPYELVDKRYFPTQSDSVSSYDSAVYFITSFEIDEIQTLALPVFVLHNNDSTPIYTRPDTVILKTLVAEIPEAGVEGLPLKENTTYKPVSYQFNYPYLIIGIALVLIIIGLVVVFYGKKIRKYFLIRKLNKQHRKFLEKFDRLLNEKERPVNEQAERLLVLWKQYLEKLEARPYTQLTTKEIINIYQPENIEDALKSLDRSIYGNVPENGLLTEKFTALKMFAQNKYEEKSKEVKNG